MKHSSQAGWIQASAATAAAVLGMACALLAGASTEHDPKEARIAQLLTETLPRMHLSRQVCDDAVATNAFENLFRALDFERVFFLATDVEKFRAEATDLDDKLRQGQVDFAYRVYDVFLQRVSNRVAFATNLIAKGFDTGSKETYSWKRRKAAWPADEAAWDEVWRKKLTHEYVGRVVAKKLAEEEKAAQTNAPAKAANTETNSLPRDLNLTPEEAMRKQYNNFLTVLRDNDGEWVLERYLTAFTQAYDPHSDYMSFNESEDFEIGMRLSLVGIGALLSTDDGMVRVERIIKGGPAAKDGRLKAGDKIIAVAQGEEESVDIVHRPLNKTVRLIRGKKDTKVTLTVLPASDPTGSTVTKITLVRDEVKIEEQAAKKRVEEIKGADGVTRRLGVITLPEFYADLRGSRNGTKDARSASKDVIRLIEELKAEKVDGLVFDMRNNGGGALNEAISITGAFIPEGPVVQVKDQRRLQIVSDLDEAVSYDGPLVVLVNRMSASASEIVAGALQDWGRAVVVGDSKTHGKGTVQTLANLNPADEKLGSVKLTTASFYRIAGGSTQLNGVKPDIIIPSVLESMELGEEYLPNALPWTEVFQAFYQPGESIPRALPDLKRKSDERLKADPKFASYEQLVARLSERQKAGEISLNLEDRLQYARTERELQKLVQEIDPEADGEDAAAADESKEDEEKPKKPDLILAESLNILSDLIIELNRKPAEAVAHAP